MALQHSSASLQRDEVQVILLEVDVMGGDDLYASLDESANRSVAGSKWMQNAEAKVLRLRI